MAYTIRQYQTKSGKRYEVRYRKPDGSSTGRRGFKRKMDADAWGAANVTTAKSVGAYIDPQAGRRLVEDFWEPWLAAKKTKAKPSYIKSLEDAWRVHVEPQWGMTLDVYADLFDDDLDDLSERMGGLLFSQNVGKMWAKATQGIDGTVETASV